ncbi:hypothetical protein [Microbulbifer epialgicus]|uniref:Uncharacterized protein n=1 Tax=Microbulbifer epialgicus TaxID=393907 RepID=A0ABV4NYQ8_9GAMM
MPHTSSQIDTEKLITAQELEQPILVRKALQKAKAICDRFNTTKANRDYIYFRKGLTKELFEEVIPLAIYGADKYAKTDVILQYYSGSSNSFDGDFISSEGRLIERVEVTYAVDGHTVQLQRECATQFGEAPLTRKPRYSGNSKNRVIHPPEIEIEPSSTPLGIQVKLITEAFEKKNKNIHKYKDMTLLIAVEFPLLLPFEEESIIKKVELKGSGFNSVYIVDVYSKLCKQIA